MSVLDTLDPAIREAAKWLVAVAEANDLRPIVTSARRSKRTQQKLFDAWKAGRSRFPAAIPGTSKHERGLAFDLAILKGGLSATERAYLTALGHLWESIGGRWGGRFGDPIHFEHPTP